MILSLLPAFLLSANLFKVHFPPLTSPLMKSQSSIGSGINPWGTPLVTEFQLDFMLLIGTPWAQKFSQFSIHLAVHLSSPCLSSVSMSKLREKTLLKMNTIIMWLLLPFAPRLHAETSSTLPHCIWWVGPGTLPAWRQGALSKEEQPDFVKLDLPAAGNG